VLVIITKIQHHEDASSWRSFLFYFSAPVRQRTPNRATERNLLKSLNDAYPPHYRRRINGMIAKLMLALLAASTMAWPADWLAEANRALEAGAPRDAEAALRAAEKSLAPQTDGTGRAELLNAWSALHLKLGQVSTAEGELREALSNLAGMPDGGDLRATVLHNLAAVEMRTARYAEAMADESAAMRGFATSLPACHPTVIRGWASLASLQYMIGRPDEAKASLDRAIASAEITYGLSHPLMADLLRSDAVVLDKLKRHREARRARDRAAAIQAAPARESAVTWNIREPASAGQAYLYSK